MMPLLEGQLPGSTTACSFSLVGTTALVQRNIYLRPKNLVALMNISLCHFDVISCTVPNPTNQTTAPKGSDYARGLSAITIYILTRITRLTRIQPGSSGAIGEIELPTKQEVGREASA